MIFEPKIALDSWIITGKEAKCRKTIADIYIDFIPSCSNVLCLSTETMRRAELKETVACNVFRLKSSGQELRSYPPWMYTLTGNFAEILSGSKDGGITIFRNKLWRKPIRSGLERKT